MTFIYNNIKEISSLNVEVTKNNIPKLLELANINKQDKPYYINIFTGNKWMRTKTVFNNEQMKRELRQKFGKLIDISKNGERKIIVRKITINSKNVV